MDSSEDEDVRNVLKQMNPAENNKDTSSESSTKRHKRTIYVISSSEDDKKEQFSKNDKWRRSDDIEKDALKKSSNRQAYENKENENRDWTLRHSSRDENVQELVVGSGIFVNKLDMNTTLGNCIGPTELGRALLKAIFHDDALKTCSLSGKMSNSRAGVPVKPGLHKKAIDTILRNLNIFYVMSYAKDVEWPPKDKQTILASMRGKVSELSKIS